MQNLTLAHLAHLTALLTLLVVVQAGSRAARRAVLEPLAATAAGPRRHRHPAVAVRLAVVRTADPGARR